MGLQGIPKFLEQVAQLFYLVPIQGFQNVKEVPDYLTSSVPLIFAFLAVEIIYGKTAKLDLHSFKDFISSIGTVMLSKVAGVWLKGLIIFPYSIIYQYSPFSDLTSKYLPELLSERLLGIVYFAVGMFGCDLCWYISHRCQHDWHLLWAAHSVHHSSKRFNLCTAFRIGIFQQFWGWIFYLPLAFIGLPPVEFLRHFRLNQLYQFWIHTEVIGRLPWVIELIMNTPSHHRLHHRPPGNCNYGGVFIIWDRIFGTFVAEIDTWNEKIPGTDSEPLSVPPDDVMTGKRGVIYGLARPIENFDPVYANVQHFDRLSEPPEKQTSDSVSFLGGLSSRFNRILPMLLKRRSKQPWFFQLSLKHLVPDLLYQQRARHTFEAVPNTATLLKDCRREGKEEKQNLARLNQYSHRDIEFITNRDTKERGLSMIGYFVVGVHLLLTTAVAKKIFAKSDDVYNGSWIDQTVIALLSLIVGFSLHSINWLYF